MNIDEQTKGLADKITYETLHQLNEDNFITRGLNSIKDKLLSAGGSSAATGRLKQQKAANYLMAQWKEYAAIGQKPWTFQNLSNFLMKTFGQHGQDISQALLKDPYIKKVAGNPATDENTHPQQNNQTPPSTTKNQVRANRYKPATNTAQNTKTQTSTPTPVPPPGGEKAIKSVSPAIAGANSTRLQGALIQAAEQPKPNKTLVMQLINQLLQTAKKESKTNPKAWTQAISNINAVKAAYSGKIPELNQIPNLSESKIFEAPVNSRERVEPTFGKSNSASAPQAPAQTSPPNPPSSSGSNSPQAKKEEEVSSVFDENQISKILTQVAAWALDNNIIEIDNSRWSKALNALMGRDEPNTGENFGRSYTRNQASNSHTSSDRYPTAKLNPRTFYNALNSARKNPNTKAHFDDASFEAIRRAYDQANTNSQFTRNLKRSGISALPVEIMSAFEGK